MGDFGSITCYVITLGVILATILGAWFGTNGFGLGAKIEGKATIQKQSNKTVNLTKIEKDTFNDETSVLTTHKENANGDIIDIKIQNHRIHYDHLVKMQIMKHEHTMSNLKIILGSTLGPLTTIIIIAIIGAVITKNVSGQQNREVEMVVEVV